MTVPVRAISLHQPWATLFALGEKALETRSWETRYRGIVLMHASRAKPNAEALQSPVIRGVLARHGYFEASHLPYGCILARAELVGCARVTEAMNGAGEPTPILRIDDAPCTPSGIELAAGNFTPGRFAWHFRRFMALVEPIDVSGRQGLWIPEPAIAAQALADPGYLPDLYTPRGVAAAGANR